MAGTRDYNNANAKTNAVESSAGYSDFDINFVAHPISGDIAIKRDSDAIKRSVRNIILTNHYERPFKPNFGANLRSMIFELTTPGMAQMFQRSLRKAISTTEPRVSNVFIRAVDRDNSVDITIAYNIEGIVDQQNLEVSVSRVR